MTKETFKTVMKYLDGAYPKQALFAKENTAKVWYEALSDLNDDRVLEAVKDIIKTEDFPTIAKIRAEATIWKPKKLVDIDVDAELAELDRQWQEELKEMRNEQARAIHQAD